MKEVLEGPGGGWQVTFEDVNLQRDDLWKGFKGRGFLRNWKLLSKACWRDSGPRV